MVFDQEASQQECLALMSRSSLRTCLRWYQQCVYEVKPRFGPGGVPSRHGYGPQPSSRSPYFAPRLPGCTPHVCAVTQRRAEGGSSTRAIEHSLGQRGILLVVRRASGTCAMRMLPCTLTTTHRYTASRHIAAAAFMLVRHLACLAVLCWWVGAGSLTSRYSRAARQVMLGASFAAILALSNFQHSTTEKDIIIGFLPPLAIMIVRRHATPMVARR